MAALQCNDTLKHIVKQAEAQTGDPPVNRSRHGPGAVGFREKRRPEKRYQSVTEWGREMIPSKESLQKLNAWIASLPEEAKGKCTMCNETLTHLVKQAEAQTGAPMTTVCRALADEANKDAAPMDKVTPRALVERVRTKEGKDLISSDRGNEQEPEQTEKEEQPEMQPAATVLLTMSKIRKKAHWQEPCR